jgi:flagellin-like hook-associated protein FlgL
MNLEGETLVTLPQNRSFKMSAVTLTAAMRSNLNSMQQTSELMTATQSKLATGLKVNSALDNPSSYFAALAHRRRADDLEARKDGVNEAVQNVKAASSGVEGLQKLLDTAKGLIQTARTSTTNGYTALYTQFNEVASQIKQLIADSGYKGTNFLNGTGVSLDVLFNESGTNKLTLAGFDANVTGILGSSFGANYTVVAAGFSNISSVDSFSQVTSLDLIDKAITAAIGQLEVESAKMSANLAIMNARLDFADSLIDTERTGADNLTLADTNLEGANMLALQTRNQLGTTALSLSSQAAQSILRLF